VEFQYSPQRLDLPNGLKLEGIVVKDFREEDVERYVLNHRYFNSSVLTHSCLNAFCQKSENTYRLCLQDIYKIGSDQSQLLYRKFIYDEREDYLIPPRFSIHKDHWGYGNNPSAHDASHFYFDVPEITFDDGLVLGGDRKNVGAGSLSLLLKKMIIETKGSVHYDYEQNLTGGGRIWTITINDNENEENNVVKTYTYEDPSNIVEPVYHYRYSQYYLNAIYPLSIYGIPITLRDDCNLDIIIRTSKSMKALYDIDGISVGYGRVRETLGDGSFTEYEFTNSEDRPNENPYVYTGVVPFSNAWSGISDKTERTDYHSPPFFPHTYKGWERGLLKGKKIFDSGGHLKHETINQYYFEMNDRK